MGLCLEKDIHILGINKTSRQTDNVRPIIGVINEYSSKNLKNKAWLYQREGLSIIKFHPNSDFCFRVEYCGNGKIMDIVSKIAYYSSDPEIIGYPYPLFKADKVARIKEFEKNSHKNHIKIISRELKKDFVDFDEKSAIFHDVLDKRAYK